MKKYSRKKLGRRSNNRPLDHTKNKRKPNSFAALFKSIRMYWKVDSQEFGKERNVDSFVNCIEKEFESVSRRYPGIAGLRGIRRWLNRIENTGEQQSDSSEISYFQMRVFAEYCKIPCNLLMVYSHAVALVRKADQEKLGPNFILSFLDRIIDSLLLLRSRLESACTEADMKNILIANDIEESDQRDDECPYEVKTDILEEMQDIFWNSGDTARCADESFQQKITGNF